MKITLEAEDEYDEAHLKALGVAGPALTYEQIREYILAGTMMSDGLQPRRVFIGKGEAVRLLECIAGAQEDLRCDMIVHKIRGKVTD